MAIILSSRTRSAVALVKYIKYDDEHNDRTEMSDSKNCMESHAEYQMLENAKKFDKSNNVQAYHVIQSFPELDPGVPEHYQLALDISNGTIEKAFGNDRMVFSGVHIDGKSGILHVHSAVANADLITGKCLKGDASEHKNLIKCMNESMDEHGVENVLTNNLDGLKTTKYDSEGKYNAKNDIRDKINQAIGAGVTSYEELGQYLEDNFKGANLHQIELGNDDYGYVIQIQPEQEIANNKNVDGSFKCGLSRLGKSYSQANMNDYFNTNMQALEEEQEKQRLLDELDEIKKIEMESDDNANTKENDTNEYEFEYKSNFRRNVERNEGDEKSTELDNSRTGEIEDSSGFDERIQQIMQDNARRLNEDAIDEELDGEKTYPNDRIISASEPAIGVEVGEVDIDLDIGIDFDFDF